MGLYKEALIELEDRGMSTAEAQEYLQDMIEYYSDSGDV